jgi:hypothetical protein
MGSSDLSSRNNVPLAVIPERGKVFNDSDPPVIKEPWNILSEHVSGSKYANGTGELGPEPTGVVFAFALAGDGDWLAGESSADEVNRGQASSAAIPERLFTPPHFLTLAFTLLRLLLPTPATASIAEGVGNWTPFHLREEVVDVSPSGDVWPMFGKDS